MQTQKTQSLVVGSYVPKHVRMWLNNQKTLMEKPHVISKKEARFELSKNVTIVRK